MFPFVNRGLRGNLQVSCLLLVASLLLAQTARKTSPAKPSSSFKLVSIKATGSKRYTPDEIITATALPLGQLVSEDDFKQAAQHLVETGAFNDIVYSFQFASEGAKLAFQVTDNDQLVPATFDNIVWFTDAELADKLHARVPLFQSQLPMGGNLADQVSDALQALLIERNTPGRADYLRLVHEDGPIEAFIFTVAAHNIRIRNTEFPGASPAELTSLQAIAAKLQGQDYLRSVLRIQADKNFMPVYLERGYLKAAFSDSQAKVVQDSAQETLVDVIIAVDPGRQYKLTAVQWLGNAVFSSDKLQPLIHLAAGQPANAVQLDADLENVKKLYGTRGYVTAAIKPVAQTDDAQSTVTYEIQVQEGDVYKMGELDIRGLDDHSVARLVEAWKLPAGQPYDSSYPKRFLDEAMNSLLPAGEWNVSVHESPDRKDKTVDVSLHFSRKSPK